MYHTDSSGSIHLSNLSKSTPNRRIRCHAVLYSLVASQQAPKVKPWGLPTKFGTNQEERELNQQNRYVYVTTWHGTVWFQGFLAVSRETAVSWYPTAVLILKHVLFNQVSEKCVWTRNTCAIRKLRLAPANKKHQKTRLRIATIISSTNRKLNQREQESLYVAFQRHLNGVNYTLHTN